MPDVSGGSLGSLIRDLRQALGHSQGRLAERLSELTGVMISREYVSRWECGKRTPSRFWLPHLATALRVPLDTLEAERVRRRHFLQLAATVPALGLPGITTDLMTSIAGGDPAPLTTVQTAHRTDLALAELVTTDRASVLHLARWMRDGDSDVLRVNAAGILAKARVPDLHDEVAVVLGRDSDTRTRYAHALTVRAGGTVTALADEVHNGRDSGARWCAAWLLGKDGSPAARAALTAALRHDPVRENVRAFGLMLNGADPCT